MGMKQWFEHTIEGAEFDILVCGELEEVVTEWRSEVGVGTVPVATEVIFTDVEASRIFDDRWVDLPAEEAERLAAEHRGDIVESTFDACIPAD